jgi:hypothetical protein
MVLLAQYCVLATFAILNVAELRLRSQSGCGLVLDQNPSFVDGHQSLFVNKLDF